MRGDTKGAVASVQVLEDIILRMCGRAASLFACKGDVEWLTGPGLCAARYHMIYRLFNILVRREEITLELELVQMTSEKEQHRLDPTAKPFIPKGIKMLKRCSFQVNGQNIKCITAE